MNKKKKVILSVAVAVIIMAIIAAIIMVNASRDEEPEVTISEEKVSEENLAEENAPEDVPDFDFTFSVSMLNCTILGTDISEVTQESLLAYAKEEGLEYIPEEYSKYYAGEGFYIDDRKDLDGEVWISGLENYSYVESDSIVVCRSYDTEVSHYLLEPYKDFGICAIEEEFLGQTYEEFFNGLAEGLYDKAEECPGEPYGEEEEGHITFNNGYVCNAVKPRTGTWGTDVYTDEWFIVFEENGQKVVVRVCSISNETIDLIDIRYKK